MEQNIGLLVAAVAIIAGLVLIVPALLRASRNKQQQAIEGDVQHKNGLPITPRDERERPTFDSVAITAEDDAPDALKSMAAVAASSNIVAERTEPSPKVASTPSPAVQTAVDETLTSQTVTVAQPDVSPDDHAAEYATEYTAEYATDEMTQETAAKFEQNSPLLDKHLSDQETFDQDNSPLLNAQDTITVVISPRNQFTGIQGKTVLNVVREYGLKYGVMNMFHRYEHENGTGDLWFSMLGANDEGVQPFDLNVLAESRFNSLLLFLSLPHPHALRGFDSMVSVAQMMADELDADLYDEQGYRLDDGEFAKLRTIAADYQ